MMNNDYFVTESEVFTGKSESEALSLQQGRGLKFPDQTININT